MKKFRPSLPYDQENAEKAYQLIMETMNLNAGIETTLWCGAVWSVLVNGYKQSGFSYEDFIKEMHTVSKYYESWWEKDC
jgi:hypothetical protein